MMETADGPLRQPGINAGPTTACGGKAPEGAYRKTIVSRQLKLLSSEKTNLFLDTR
jgi:hypothetical protein